VIIYHTFLSIRLNYLLKKGEFFKNDWKKRIFFRQA
jgi:hypothetical protein